MLVGYIDDASNLIFLRFTKGETTDALMKVTLEYIEQFGCPVAFYVDKDSVYKTNRGEDSSTQFSRLMNAFGIRLIYANSPQAKGRVERLFKTLQDRLIKEMRLNNICTIEEANKFLEDIYIKDHNEKFSVEPKSNYNMHKKTPKDIKVEKVFVKRDKRSIANDYTVKYKGRFFQILDNQKCNVLTCHKIVVEESLDKSIRLNYKGIFLKFTEISEKHSASYSKRVWMPTGTGNR